MRLITNPRYQKNTSGPAAREPAMTLSAEHASDTKTQVRRAGLDTPLLVTTLVLLLIGLISVYSASAPQAINLTGNSFSIVLKQTLAAVLGLGIMWGVAQVRFQLWAKYDRWLAVGVIILLAVTLLMGKTVNGSERWIALPGGFQFQPSELAKLAAVLLLAKAISVRKRVFITFLANLALISIMIVLIYKQPNLSVSIILTLTTLTMLFVGGFLHWGVLLTAVPIAGYAMFQKIMTVGYQRRRIEGWLNPWADPQDTGYNLIQSYYAIGSGGLWGEGFGHSIQKLYYLPFPYTDFIFSVICEEWGLFGGLSLVALFGLFAWRGYAIAAACPLRFGQALAFGLTTVLMVQTVINLSVTLGLMPVTGVTLPFISYGGTSLITTLLMTGILLNISRYREVSQPDATPLHAARP